MVKLSRLLPTCKVSRADRKIPALSLFCVSPAAALPSCVFATAHVPGTLASLLRDLQAGCEVMELGRAAALHDYVEKYVCAYVCSLAVACYHGPFPVFCPIGKTQLLGMGPVVECLAFMRLGPGVIARQPK